MAYVPPSLSEFNAAPPPDDGSQVESNSLEWARDMVAKIGTPLKTFAEAINTAVKNQFDATPDYTRTQAEIDASVIPTDTKFKPGDIRRYGAGTDQSASTNDTAIANALLSADEVRLPQDGDGSVYPISSSFTLGRFGQRVVGDVMGNPIASTSTEAGPRLDVVSGFPTTGGDAAQAVFNLTSRNQRIENLGIDCNNIADIGVYATGSLITRTKLSNILIQDPAGDGVKYFDNTFMHGMDNVVVASPGGWGFNFDATSGSSGHTTISLTNCYVTSATSGGFRFDAVTGFTMDACAVDSTTAFALRLENGSVGTIDGMDTENTTRLFDLSENASLKSRLKVSGSRFLNYGDDAAAPANVIDNGGVLQVESCSFQGGESATLFLETDSGSETNWYGNTLDLEGETNSIHASSVVRADHWIHTSNTAAAVERLRIESASTPRLHLRELGQSKDGQIVVDGGVLKVQTIDGTTLSVEANILTIDLTSRATILGPGSGKDLTLSTSAGKCAAFGATPIVKPTGVAVSDAGIHAALVSLGWIAGP